MFEHRNATPEDARAIATLHARSWREHYRGEFLDAFLDGDLVGERLGVWRARLSRDDPDQLVRVALEHGEVVGFVCAYADHDPEWGSFVDNLHVATPSKGRGLGAALMRAVGDWLEARCPATAVHLLVLESNRAARRFYERIGGRDAGVAVTETHGGARVRSCRYVWESPALVARSGRTGTRWESGAF